MAPGRASACSGAADGRVLSQNRCAAGREGTGKPVAAGTFRVIFGADDTNECVTAVREFLQASWETQLVDASSWPEMSAAVARGVASGEFRYGVLMCWTGTGTAMAAN